MIYAYGVTQQGAYHVKKGLVCQDAHSIIRCGEDRVVAAVADGLGSEEHSDIASRLAADIATRYCAEHITRLSSDEEILDVIRQSFLLAQNRIEETAEENGDTTDQYDTTLSLAVLYGDALYYGHAGDSGIVALTTEGLYRKVTEQQRDAEGRVYPLYFGEEKWVIGKFADPVASVFLATDGMYEILFPIYIRNEKVSIYVALARYFMDPEVLGIREGGDEAAEKKIEAFMSSISPAQLSDDKTVVVIGNTDTVYARQSEEYYAEPDWPALQRKYQEEWRRKAYPSLYEKEQEDQGEKPDNAGEDV